jgi:hypothetical protein
LSTIRGTCGLPFGMLSQLLLKTGLLWKHQGLQTTREERNFSLRAAAFAALVYTNGYRQGPMRPRTPEVRFFKLR